jgi:hypothetical protein
MTEKEVVTFVSSLEEQAMARWAKAKDELMVATPNSLLKAIRNGIDESLDRKAKRNVNMDAEEVILNHVKDFLAQKFTPFMAGDGSVVDCTAQALWEKVIKNEK